MTLTVTDNADGSGALAVVAGSSGGSNTVFTQFVQGVIGSGTWTASDTRTGDGAVAISLAKGYYFAYCLTAPSTLSGLAYFAVTSGLDAVPDRCFAAVKAQLGLLNLPCTQNIYDYNFSADPKVKYPCVVMTTEGVRQTDEATMNGRDDLGHPVRLLIRDNAGENDEVQQTRFRSWRQSINRAFINQRLPGVIESIRNKVEFGVLLRRVTVKGLENKSESELVIRCITREVRGLGA